MEGLGVCIWFASVCLLFGLFLLAWIAVVNRIRPKHYWRCVLASVPVIFVVLFGVHAAILFYAALPNVIFRGSLGFEPTPDVTIVNSYRDMPTDWDDTYLEFYADQSTIDRILKKGYTPISTSDIVEYQHAPEWWTPSTGPGARIYATHTDDPGFRSDFRYFVSHELLMYDPVSKKAYYRYRR
jgi:hypothetical protein